MAEGGPVVADSGPLIALATVGHFDLLRQIYQTLLIPTAVAREVTKEGGARPGAQEITQAGWIEHVPAKPAPDPFLVEELDLGEAEAIALAVQRGALLLVDERRGRRVAELVYRLRVRGTVGTLAVAKRLGLIPRIRPILEALQQSGYYVSTSLVERACASVGE